jgi:hypothetical protein
VVGSFRLERRLRRKWRSSEFGGEVAPEFDGAAAEAARAAGMSDTEIVELLGYLPPPRVSV